MPKGIWVKCTECSGVIYRVELNENLRVCPKCNHHMKMKAKERIESFLEPATAKYISGAVKPIDKLKFKDSRKYKDRLSEAQKRTGILDALEIARGKIKDIPVVVSAFEFDFLGGSMGSVVGERFVHAVTASIEDRSPLVCFCTSGGARMQESMFSLLQMAKTTAAIRKLKDEGIPYITVLANPTMGGVSASLAMLGDIIIAEPKALIGFAGPRVIEQTVKQSLPEGFQRAEFQLAHGAIDMVADRREIQGIVYQLLSILLSKRSITSNYDNW